MGTVRLAHRAIIVAGGNDSVPIHWNHYSKARAFARLGFHAKAQPFLLGDGVNHR